jgi:hypothetical protein
VPGWFTSIRRGIRAAKRTRTRYIGPRKVDGYHPSQDSSIVRKNGVMYEIIIRNIITEVNGKLQIRGGIVMVQYRYRFRTRFTAPFYDVCTLGTYASHY